MQYLVNVIYEESFVNIISFECWVYLYDRLIFLRGLGVNFNSRIKLRLIFCQNHAKKSFLKSASNAKGIVY